MFGNKPGILVKQICTKYQSTLHNNFCFKKKNEKLKETLDKPSLHERKMKKRNKNGKLSYVHKF